MFSTYYSIPSHFWLHCRIVYATGILSTLLLVDRTLSAGDMTSSAMKSDVPAVPVVPVVEVNEDLDDWLARREKRQRYIDFVKDSPQYLSLREPPEAPDPCDRLLSKRAWEKASMKWRIEVQNAVIAMFNEQ